MDFYEMLDQVLILLQRHGRVSYRALVRQFGLDDAYLEDLKHEILYVQKGVVEDGNRGLCWTRESPDSSRNTHPETDSEGQFHAALPAVIAFIQREERVTYRTLKRAYRLSDQLLAEICDELRLRRLAIDEEGKFSYAWPHGESYSCSKRLPRDSTNRGRS